MANGAEARWRQHRRARMSAVPCWGGIGVMMLETNSLIVILVIGLIAGWLAGKIMGGGFGLIGDVVIGVIGAFVGGWLWATLHLPILGPWWLTAIVSAVVGACILLFIIRLLKR
jgi:uncharacterized membrane protein YeaQ/YmgE (transglycosylase-associated protein family)